MIEAVFGLVGVIVGSLITISKDSWTLYRQRRRERSYSAIRLICILEEYANKCTDVAIDDGYAEGRPAGRTDSGEEFCEAQVAAPGPLDYPSDIAWRSLNEAIMHRLLALPNKARSTNRFISVMAEHAFPPDYSEFFETRQEGYARLGLEALNVVGELRKQHRVTAEGRTEMNIDWDPKEHLKGVISRIEERAAKRRNDAKTWNANLNPTDGGPDKKETL